jgi:hypothetical protein
LPERRFSNRGFCRASQSWNSCIRRSWSLRRPFSGRSKRLGRNRARPTQQKRRGSQPISYAAELALSAQLSASPAKPQSEVVCSWTTVHRPSAWRLRRRLLGDFRGALKASSAAQTCQNYIMAWLVLGLASSANILSTPLSFPRQASPPLRECFKLSSLQWIEQCCREALAKYRSS